MSKVESRHLDPEPDILQVVMQRVRSAIPTPITEEQAATIEEQIRSELGGLRVRIPKRKKHPTKEQRQEIFQDALGAATDEEITRRHGISRRSLYRYVKRGNGQ